MVSFDTIIPPDPIQPARPDPGPDPGPTPTPPIPSPTPPPMPARPDPMPAPDPIDRVRELDTHRGDPS